MASTGLVHARTRRLKRQESKNEDMLIKLPEEVLIYILSLLPPKEAVRTSILSRRWEYLWTFLPNLIVELTSEEDRNFVDRALFLRESSIQMFSLDWSVEPFDELHLRRWITDVVRRLNVKELHLAFPCYDFRPYAFEFPRCLFASASLTRLSFSMFWNLKLPKSVSLSSLKHLVLETVVFNDSESVDKLFKGCSMLETTRLVQCIFACDFRISAPKLYELEIEENTSLDVPFGDNVVIVAPCLKFFSLWGDFKSSYALNCPSSIVETVIRVENWSQDDWEIFLHRLYKLLKGIYHVKKLSFSCGTIKALNHESNHLPEVPLFNNLSILSFDRHRAIELDVGIGLMRILQNSPCLETVRFEGGIILPARYKYYRGILKPVPPCFMSCLKRLEILFDSNYEDQQLFTNAARILLKRAVVLEKLIVYLPNRYSTQRSRRVDHPMVMEELIQILIELPRASEHCQIEFVHSAMK